jgi:protein arginine N-methyltransferase 5
LKALQSAEFKSTSTTSHILADPIVPPLTTEDTGLFPSQAVSTYVAYVSPWIELGSMDPVIAAISRQVLNLEIAYAGFCGIQMVVIPGPCGTAISRGQVDLAQHARAVKEALLVGSRLLLVVQLAMWPDIGSFDPKRETLAGLAGAPTKSSLDEAAFNNDRDFLVNWEAWHLIRSVCNYSKRLSVCEFVVF